MTTTEWAIRPAREDDAAALWRLSAELGYAIDPRDVTPRLAAVRAAGGEILVAERAGRPVGWAQLGVAPALVEARTARLVGLVVSADARGAGVGRALVAAAEDWAIRRGAVGLALSSNVVRHDAHAFYDRLGFARTKTQLVFHKPLPKVESARAATDAASSPSEDLYHVSDRGDIARFEPRTPPSTDGGVTEPVVWAVHASRLFHYLLPRDCPRLSYQATAATTEADRQRWLDCGGARAGLVVETGWWERIRTARLWVYTLPRATFRLTDAGAGYHVSTEPVEPVAVREITDVPAALLAEGVEWRVVPTLWPLHDAILNSTLGYSFIRMRHATARREVTAG